MAKDALSLLRMAVIGGSAGSIEVLINILPQLPAGRNHPALLIVLHRAAGGESDMARMLGAYSRWPVREAEDKTPAEPGRVYIAPPDYHLLVEKNGLLSLDYSEKLHYCRPAIDATFESAAEAFGNRVSALLLSGANRDGAAGLQAVVQSGGTAAVQEPAFASSRFMPEAALALNRSLPRLKEDQMIPFLLGPA